MISKRDQKELIVHKDGTEKVHDEFEQFNDRELQILNKVVQVYTERIN